MLGNKKTKSNYLICPVCGIGKLLRVNESVNLSSLGICLSNKNLKVKYFVKCPCCKKQIGIP